jgi:2-polyprenyl-3-methyl-5-hydroxy-6-metoxy-1,4-benzoquinol methylase
MKDHCPLCSQPARYVFKKSDYQYKRCTSCGTLFVANILDPQQVYPNYSEAYFEANSSKNKVSKERRGYPSYREAEESLINSFDNKLKLICRYINHGKLLEVGAAYGTFMSLANQYFRCTGLDVSAHAARMAREIYGLEVQQGGIEQKTEFKENTFDVVAMWDVIEHLIQPIEALKEAYRVLKPGGMIFFSTDDANNWLPRLLGSKWWALAAPLHICHFSKKGVEAAFCQAGEFEKIGFVSDKRVYGIGEIVSHFGVSYKNKLVLKIGKWLERTALGSKSITVNRPEQFITFAQKKSL